MARVLLIAIVLFASVYALALVIYLVGTFGLFGADRDPLSGAYLIILGLPWNRFIDALPERLWPWLAASAPLANLGILWVLRLFAVGRTGSAS